jgi:CrcB protein
LQGGPWAPHLLGLVAAGGAAGSVLRYAVGIWCAQRFGAELPWGTLAVNVAGSAAIGLLGGLMIGGMPISNETRLLLITGALGGFTTFSAFSLDVGLLAQRSAPTAFLYLMATLVLGLGAFAVCFWLGRQV